MTQVKRLLLNVLKPHQPNALQFAQAIAGLGIDYRVTLQVMEVDDQIESTVLSIIGDALDYPAIEARINDLGGSVHNIDEVEIHGGDAESAESR